MCAARNHINPAAICRRPARFRSLQVPASEEGSRAGGSRMVCVCNKTTEEAGFGRNDRGATEAAKVIPTAGPSRAEPSRRVGQLPS